MRIILKIFDFILDLFAFIGGVLCILMMLGVSADVIGRYFLSLPISGMVEANQVMILWIVFLAAAWVLKRGHTYMDIIVQMVKPQAQNWLNLITSILSCITSLVLFWYSLNVVIGLFQDGTIENGNININSGYTILPIPIGSLLLGIQFFRIAWGHWMSIKVRLASPAKSKWEITDKVGVK